MSNTALPKLRALRKQLDACCGAERFSLRRALFSVEKSLQSRSASELDADCGRLEARIAASIQKRALRQQNLPKPEYPEELPVAARREEIIKTIAAHQVVIICGETGSGKTTQLPKMCLELGRGVDGFIGHTQPRRIAARSVAARIAEELKTPLGQQVGYKVRFHDRSSPESYLKLMTDGILLAEIQQDRFLNQYDTLIIDEAHERSLNIDFLLGYLKWLLPKRRELKVIITSATIDPERFSRHFDNAPIINVSGRTYPVETRYRPLIDVDAEEEFERDQTEAILDAVDELSREAPGDILIFLPGEREIRETAEALRKHHPPATEILPLFARLSAEEQHRIFEPHGRRRIVLATNVAETSLTVPGIKYVVDSGYARISRYSWRAGVQRLPIEKVSQASANQRSGRCGRVSNGIAIRLYSEEDFSKRPLFTEPEILRTNLAAVILQLATMWIAEVEEFPFVEPPDTRLIRDGYKLLFELGAVDADYRVTPIGHQLAKLPLDPRFGRMLLAAKDNGVLPEVLVIVSALTLQDPRERPLDKQQAADEKHSRFKDEQSDFLSFLKLWKYYHEQRKHLSQRKFRELCQKEFLSFVRLREWHDIHVQLHQMMAEMFIETARGEVSETPNYDAIHQSLLTGLLGNIGMKDEEREYQGAGGRKFHIFPASGLRKKAPQWVMAAELVETSRLFGRTIGKIQPEWVETLAAHLLRHHYTEPHWEQKAAQVAAFERTSLYGITITPRRKVSYGKIDPPVCRELFIRHALVYGEYRTSAPFARHNTDLISEIETLEAKGRRRDILVDEHRLYAFYDQRIPAHVVNGHSFERWRKQAEHKQPKLLYLSREYLMEREAGHEKSGQFPDTLQVQGMILPLRYHFDPRADDDGVTVRVPLLGLNQLTPTRFDYLVPGMLEEKITAMIRGLPKQVRKQFVPAPDYAHACVEAIQPCDETPLQATVEQQLQRMTGSRIPAEAWAEVALDNHLLMRFEVVDDSGNVIKAGRDLEALKGKVRQQTRQELAAQPVQSIERIDITAWDFGDLPENHWLETAGSKLRTWPALVDASNGQSVAIRLFDNEADAQNAHWQGVLRLFLLALPAEVKDLPRHVPQMQTLCLHYAATGKCEELKESITRYVFRQVFADYLNIRKQDSFAHAIGACRQQIFPQTQETARLLAPSLALYHDIRKQLKGRVQPTWLEALNDINDQLNHLVYPGFLNAVSPEELRHFPRYLKGIQRRLQKLAENPAKDRSLRVQVQPYWDRWKDAPAAERSRSGAEGRGNLHEYRWMLEEFRISLFAQELGTARPVSAKRLDALWKEA
ncbi:MAG: ATP-dependent RNA helicase HrpA [Gammaproteobacteria bacterium]|nr:ATP-dependent RNA helicase HrpA [Gammaproteobacteria bacterium]MBU1724326.1 ATP-dependent RNA helicase HrpA [Gammaproteobacteria bacterium]MBU2006246.1 ATP-dependent RNA helicase HrpA [Gammaproteobacteria bacterium]